MKNPTFAVIAVMALTVAGCARLQEKPSGFGSVVDFHGLSLLTAPHESDLARLSDLFHAVPAGSASYEIRPEVRTVYTGLDGTVYHIPSKDIFFVQHDPVGSNTVTYYGPFKGSPQELMNLPKQKAYAADGMVDVKSSSGVKETADRLESILKEEGMTIFNRVNHSEAAKTVGVELRDTELILFGNPKAGSPLMKCQQSVAIDLPQKALIWTDSEGNTWISYNNPRYLKNRHNISNCEEVISQIEKALAGITKAAATK